MRGGERAPPGMIVGEEDGPVLGNQTGPPQSSWVLLCGEVCQDAVSAEESPAVSSSAMSWGQCEVGSEEYDCRTVAG